MLLHHWAVTEEDPIKKYCEYLYAFTGHMQS